MNTKTRRRAPTFVCAFLFALVAATTLNAGATSASITSALVIREGSTIGIGPFTFERQAVATAPYVAGDLVDGVLYDSTSWFVTGDDPSISTVNILFEIDLFTHDAHLQILEVIATLPSGCKIIIDGPFLANLVATDTYHIDDVVGDYLKEDCTPQEAFLILAALGADPSSATFLATFLIGMELI